MSEVKYGIRKTSRFEKDVKRLIKQGKDMALLNAVVTDIASGSTLDAKYKDHALAGNWKGFRDCHIVPDWILLYKIEEDILTLTLTRSGSHSELEL